MGTAFYNDLTVSGPWGTAVANGSSIRGGFAPAYNTMSLVLHDSGLSPLYLADQAVIVTLTVGGATHTLFIGRVRTAKRVIGPGEDAIHCEVDGEESMADINVVNSPRGHDEASLGWRCVFNAADRPNRHPTTNTFYDGPDAIHWTAAEAIKYIRDNHDRQATWMITDLQLAAVSATAWKLPTLDLRGQRILAAYAEILSRVGCRLSFRYASGSCAPAIFDYAGTGTYQVEYPPATDEDAEVYRLAVGYSTRKTTPVMYAVSGYYLHECSYASNGADPLLAGSASKDTEYAWEYAVDVTQYAAHNCGVALTAGERPKPIMRKLATRRDAAGSYYTAAEVTAEPEIGEQVDPKETLAVYDSSTWKRVTGGAQLVYSPDTDGVVLRLKHTIRVAESTAGKSKNMKVGDSMPNVRVTLATRLRKSRTWRSSTYATDVDTDRVGIVNGEKITPATRYNAILPDATPNAWLTLSAVLEDYVDVDTRLQELLSGLYQQRARNASTVEVFLPFVHQEIPIGALLDVANAPANSGLSGREIIVSYRWDLNSGIEPTITATDSLDAFFEQDFLKSSRAHAAAIRRTRKPTWQGMRVRVPARFA